MATPVQESRACPSNGLAFVPHSYQTHPVHLSTPISKSTTKIQQSCSVKSLNECNKLKQIVFEIGRIQKQELYSKTKNAAIKFI